MAELVGVSGIGTPQPGRTAGPLSKADRDAVSSLRDLDAKSARDLMALLAWLRSVDPESADRLAGSIREMAEAQKGGGEGTAPAADGAGEGAAPAVAPSAPGRGTFELSLAAVHIEIESIRVQFSAVDTPEGRQVSASIERFSLSIDAFAAKLGFAPAKPSDPLVLVGDGDTLRLAPDRVEFDLDADGSLDRFTPYANGYLAYDRNGNGRIDDGGELFGDQHGAADGFAELARYDANSDGVIDREDPIYGDLEVVDLVARTRTRLAAGGVEQLLLRPQSLAHDPTEASFVSHRADAGTASLYEAWHRLDTVS